jgi:hypothetical protein
VSNLRPNRKTPNRKTAVFATAVLLAIAAPAAAQHGGEPDPPIVVSYDDELGIIVYSFPSDDPEAEPVDCELAEGVMYSVDDEDNVTTVNGEGAPGDLAEGCMALVIDPGNNDKVTHGAVVSQTVHALKELGLDGPFGQYVREIAHSDAGKEDQAARAEEREAAKAERDAAKAERAAERDAAKAERRAAKDAD